MKVFIVASLVSLRKSYKNYLHSPLNERRLQQSFLIIYQIASSLKGIHRDFKVFQSSSGLCLFFIILFQSKNIHKFIKVLAILQKKCRKFAQI